MMKKKTKIWVGIGAFVIAGGGAAMTPWTAADARALPDFSDAANRCAPAEANFVLAQAAPHDAAQHGGEGGEGGEGGIANLPPALAFARTIALIDGHLLIGDELVGQKLWDAAYPHFMHPTEELYDLIKDSVKIYNTPPFDKELKTLAQAVKNKDEKKYTSSLKSVRKALAAADAGLRAKQPAWASFTVLRALKTLEVASGEYEAAIVDGQISKPVEYQDARGFIWQADRMIEAVTPQLAKKDAAALKAMRAAIADLKQAFPTAVPPKTPARDMPAVLSAFSRVELAATPLL